jgi:hypothetical protein
MLPWSEGAEGAGTEAIRASVTVGALATGVWAAAATEREPSSASDETGGDAGGAARMPQDGQKFVPEAIDFPQFPQNI